MTIVPILTGPTATGKSALALELARARPELEIVNADSMLVYRGMDIGTAKPDASELARVPHHLIDVRDPGEAFTAGDFVREVEATLAEIASRGKRAILVGGTGFYLKALVFGLWESPKSDPAIRAELELRPSPELYSELERLDPQAAYRIGPHDRYRLVRAHEIHRQIGKTPSELEAAQARDPDPRFRLWVVDREPEELHERIALRTRQMLEAGLVAEVEALRARWPSSRALGAVGYAEVCRYLDGEAPSGRPLQPGLPGLIAEIELATRQLVKRQRTWFRGMTQKMPAPASRWFTLERDRGAIESELASL